jgi:beta-glucosidase/6-phospho-beta-glucosidase/beta-galactosidase
MPRSLALLAGFECSSHRRSDGVRVDILEQTRHGCYVEDDYALVASHGMLTVREGVRWHLIEEKRGQYDWSTVQPMIEAASKYHVEIIWDLLHFGLPDWANPYHPDFPAIFAEFAAAFARLVGSRGLYVPVNEISFMAWAAGDVEYMYPYSTGRGGHLKRALCDASIRAIHAIRQIDPTAMIIAVEPMIEVRERGIRDAATARQLANAQYEAMDMLTGRLAPELGGTPALIDVIGVNHYPQSQWFSDRETISWTSRQWTPLSLLLRKMFARYGKPILLAETGCEGEQRAAWFNYIVAECEEAQAAGVPMMGICLYPILSHIAWTGERFCPNGLFDGSTPSRDPHVPLLNAVTAYQRQGVS